MLACLAWARRTRSCSAGSRPTRCRAGSTTWAAGTRHQDEAWRRGNPVPLKADRRRGDGRGAEACGLPRRPPDRQRGVDGDGRDLWFHELDTCPDDPAIVPVRADRRRAPAVPDVHVGHDREAEGHRAHDRRLSRRRRDHAPLGLRPQTRHGHVLVRRRHRLDHRPQLHRLRPAVQRRDLGDVRGHPRPRTRTAGGRSSSATGSRSSTPPRPRSAHT